jgi:hypothetical protein
MVLSVVSEEKRTGSEGLAYEVSMLTGKPQSLYLVQKGINIDAPHEEKTAHHPGSLAKFVLQATSADLRSLTRDELDGMILFIEEQLCKDIKTGRYLLRQMQEKQDALDILKARPKGKGVSDEESKDGEARSLCDVRDEHIFNVLKSCGWNRSQAASKLGVTTRTIRYRIVAMKEHGMKIPEGGG